LNSRFQTVENKRVYLYSAYLDHRNVSYDSAVIRVFGYFIREKNPTKELKCLLIYEEHPEEVLLTDIIATTDLEPHRRVMFITAMFTCRLPSESEVRTNRAPCYVFMLSVSHLVQIGYNRTTGWINREELNITMSNISSCESAISSDLPLDNLIPVIDLEKTRVQHHNKQVNFTICVGPIYKQTYDWQDVVKFIEIQRSLGAQKFIFYLHPEIRHSLRQVLERYAANSKSTKLDRHPNWNGRNNAAILEEEEEGLVEIYEFDPKEKHETEVSEFGLRLTVYGQFVAVSDCLYRTMYRTRFANFHDLDEYFVPVKADNWSDMIARLEANITSPDRIASYNFRNLFFPLEGPNDPSYGNDSAAVRYDIKQLLKTTHEGYISPNRMRSKVMLRPDKLVLGDIHIVPQKNLVDQKRDINADVSAEEALMFHFRSWSKPNPVNQNKRMHHYSELIQERVDRAMKRYRPFK